MAVTTTTTHNAVLFVGNIVPEADTKVLIRLFTSYGSVTGAQAFPAEGGASGKPAYALVTYSHADDADCAIAALHLRYCMSPQAPLIVLYHKSSEVVSEYGRLVAKAYRDAATSGEPPAPVPLETFDAAFPRSSVPPPPMDFALPAVPLGYSRPFGAAY